MENQVSESALDLEKGYEADINSHEVEAHQLFLGRKPCVIYDQALEVEILNECLHEFESCFFEAAAPNTECLDFENRLHIPIGRLNGCRTEEKSNSLRVAMLDMCT